LERKDRMSETAAALVIIAIIALAIASVITTHRISRLEDYVDALRTERQEGTERDMKGKTG